MSNRNPFWDVQGLCAQNFDEIADTGKVKETIHKYVDGGTLRSAYQRLLEERRRNGSKPLNETNIHEDVVSFIVPAERWSDHDSSEGQHKTTTEKYYTLSSTGERIALLPTSEEPYFAGFCHQGHVVSSRDIRLCDQPGCGRVLCPQDRYEYKPERFKCRTHYLRWRFGRILFFFASFFIEFEEENAHVEE